MADRPLQLLDADCLSGASLAQEFAGRERLALDTESDSYHRYYEKICLIQLSSDGRDYIYDPLKGGLHEELREILTDPSITWVLHGADYDVRSFVRSYDLRLGRVFDTWVAAQLLGLKTLGLKGLLETQLDVGIEKDEQRSDGGRRPLSEEQIRYARQDTRYLLPLAARLEAALESVGRLDWFWEECDNLRDLELQDKPFDPGAWRKIKGARELGELGIQAMRAAFLWRENQARQRDLPPFRIMGNHQLLQLARRIDADGAAVLRSLPSLRFLNKLPNIEGLGRVVRQQLTGNPLDLPHLDLENALPEGGESGRGRPAPRPNVKARLKQLRDGRRHWAAELALDPGFLIPSAALERIAAGAPSSVEEVGQLGRLTRWRVEAVGAQVLDALQGQGVLGSSSEKP